MCVECWAGVKFSFRAYLWTLARLCSADLPRFFDLLPYSLTLTLLANETDLSGDVMSNVWFSLAWSTVGSSLLYDDFSFAGLRCFAGLRPLSADLVPRFMRVWWYRGKLVSLASGLYCCV